MLVTILAFLVLGGGTALGAFVVSSNSQIGPGTISGHKPPTGKHANIIAGSINGTDLADGAVTPSKLGAVAAFRKFNNLPTPGFKTVIAKDGLVVRYECTGDPSADLFTVMQATTSVQHAAITLTTTFGSSTSSFTRNINFNPGDTFALTPGAESPPGEGTAVYSTPDGRVLTLNYGWSPGAPCLAHGVAIQG